MLKRPTVLIFDCGGVLVDVNRRKALKNINVFSLLPRLFANKFSFARLLSECLEELHRIQPLAAHHVGITDEYNNQLPSIVCEWLLGTTPNDALLQQIRNFLETDKQLRQETTKKRVLSYLVESTLNSDQFVSTLYLRSAMISFLEHCAQSEDRPRIYLFSNYNDVAFDLMIQRFERLRLHIDGYFVSGKEQCAKPHDIFYDRFMERFDVNPERDTCLLIDDQSGNRETGQRKGFISVHPDAIQSGPEFNSYVIRLPNNQSFTW